MTSSDGNSRSVAPRSTTADARGVASTSAAKNFSVSSARPRGEGGGGCTAPASAHKHFGACSAACVVVASNPRRHGEVPHPAASAWRGTVRRQKWRRRCRDPCPCRSRSSTCVAVSSSSHTKCAQYPRHVTTSAWVPRLQCEPCAHGSSGPPPRATVASRHNPPPPSHTRVLAPGHGLERGRTTRELGQVYDRLAASLRRHAAVAVVQRARRGGFIPGVTAGGVAELAVKEGRLGLQREAMQVKRRAVDHHLHIAVAAAVETRLEAVHRSGYRGTACARSSSCSPLLEPHTTHRSCPVPQLPGYAALRPRHTQRSSTAALRQPAVPSMMLRSGRRSQQRINFAVWANKFGCAPRNPIARLLSRCQLLPRDA